MNRIRLIAVPAAVALCAVLAVAGCKKKEAEAPVVATPPPAATVAAPPPMMTPAPIAASVTSVDLGNAAGADMKIATPMTTFGAKDKIIAAVGTRAGAAATPAKIGARWTHVDSNQTVNEESRDVQLQGDQAWDFEITNSKPWPTGKYKVEVMLDGSVVQTREFDVK
ncbi:hypothetical protein LVB87_04660 [Lysobacter sp. KIS68-7]|uniref:hypothetical protein n=1 Tax=Lysobacter sp. KIS68-7 TaxID=2904252 RepID=UPI001E2A304B|nr:hypothetical protein [Lysobacter sp. KIS68-7]UHQ20456.1 hypothetical protein LVB87_04660 [Lysobacter sp. KIS68-7]